MISKTRIAAACFGLNAIYMAIVGLLFVLSNEFMSFHSDVIQTPWDELEPAAQTLFLGMMRTEGAGFLAAAVAIAVLLLIPYRQGQAWSSWAMTAVGVVEHGPTLAANYHVATVTSASPPWQLPLLGIALLFLGLFLSLDQRHGNSGPESSQRRS